ncbi:MAG: folate-binding protein YgfZ [Thiotrichaceae bacterium]|nr:folate-binding protein YgfZ [Thiotrichaceae bacterium]PCI15039.1 MAG: glycine cleavage system protein T [Thiotrichales bacterium]
MNEQWKQYLQNAGAILTHDGTSVEHFGQAEKEQAAIDSAHIIMPITGMTFIQASGIDAKTFLQGQLTNDIVLINPQSSQLSGYCTPKGRLLALFRITQHGDGYRLHLPTCLLEKILPRLKMFVMRAKVTLEPAAAETVRIGISGKDAAIKLSAHVGALPNAIHGVTDENGITIIQHPVKHQELGSRFELIGNHEKIQSLWQRLSPDFLPTGSGAWQLLNINAAQPSVVSETVEMFIPQMLNLHVIDGVSFKKGCYPGQEVVARLHYRGKLKRHMQIAQFHSEQTPLPGMSLYPLDGGEEAQSIGNVVQVEQISNHQYRALCVLSNDFAANKVACLQRDAKAALKLYGLPYDLPADSE